MKQGKRTNAFLFILAAVILITIPTGIFAREPLTFEERVKAQEAIEKVYYNHRVWPKENPQPKPPFEKMVSKEHIKAKVTDYLKKCAALDKFWQRPIEMKQLQAEMERMAKGSKDPETLNELFIALDNDPYLIAECLARPVLADRLIRNWYANDERFHADTRAKAEEALKALTPESFCGYPEGQYSKVTYRLEVFGRERMDEFDPEDRSIQLEEKEFERILEGMPEKGQISEIKEKNDCFVIVHTIDRNDIEIAVESLSLSKRSMEEWLKNQDLTDRMPDSAADPTLYLPPMPEESCTEGWIDSSLAWTGAPEPRTGSAAVWTGTEMIIWGGSGYSSGGRYSPATDSWVPTSMGKNCPTGRSWPRGVWTGTEMIVWGGYSLNTGGRYDPATDTWAPTSTGANCPTCYNHTAVWTGTEMIVWGSNGSIVSGARYSPSTDAWVTTSAGANCPSARSSHTAIWAGTEMIIWGGYSSPNVYLDDMGRYDPSTDSWVQSSQYTNRPAPRRSHRAVWTGTEMIIWGGYTASGETNTGGRYAPATDTWIPTSTGANCPVRRQAFTAVWTEAGMIVWGGYRSGYGGSYSSGGRYSPATDTWLATSIGANCPTARYSHEALWTGVEMIVWGGYASDDTNTGGRYNPINDSWVPTSTSDGSGVPTPRSYHTAIWTGSEMVIWGGDDSNTGTVTNTGGRYQPATDTWIPTSTGTGCPAGRDLHSAVWTGHEMIVWGGINYTYRNDGGRYNVYSDTWVPTQVAGVPAARYNHTAVWTGTYMIVWGGHGYIDTLNGSINDGGRYDVLADSWIATSLGTNCPTSRESHTAVWTGTEMIVWGGRSNSLPFYKYDGGRYNPVTNVWTATSVGAGCPTPGRNDHTAVWTGQEMIVWGGGDANSSSYFNTGGRYAPGSDSWAATSTTGDCPTARRRHTAVWTGTEMVVWGGDASAHTNTGGRYHPIDDSWVQTSTGDLCPTARSEHTAVWTGGEMIVWGSTLPTPTNTGGIYSLPSTPNNFTDNHASDLGGCSSDSGVLVEWPAPSNWGDPGTGSRTFDVLRDGSPIATNLSESTLSYTDTTGENDTSYLYQVRANNGCGLSSTTNGASASDIFEPFVGEVSFLAGTFSWDPIEGVGGYRLYRGVLMDLPNLMTSVPDGCLKYQGPEAGFDCSGDDPGIVADRLSWYLVTTYEGACEGTAGEGTGFTRNLSSTDSCP